MIDIGEHGAKPGNVSCYARSAGKCKRNVSDVAAHRSENPHWAEELEIHAVRWVYGKKFGGVKRSLQETCATSREQRSAGVLKAGEWATDWGCRCCAATIPIDLSAPTGKGPGGISIQRIAKDAAEDIYLSLNGRSGAAGAFGCNRGPRSNEWQDQNEYASC